MAIIRREDKEIIHHLSLLGAMFGAVVSGFLVLHFHARAHQQLDTEAVALRTRQSLIQLTSSLTDEEATVAQTAISQVQPDFQPDTTSLQNEESFWLRLPQWGLWGLCGGAALGGGVAGYLSLWVAGWVGAIATYWLIRLVYRVIRAVAPNCAAARRPSGAAASGAFQRDQNRMLPTLIKLFMLLLMALSVLAVVVWNLIAL